ncbi:hypothetical protein D0N87_24915, partial [Pseudomonas sp. ATCC 13867]
SQQFNTWIRPLQVEAEGEELRVYAPNRFVLDWVNEKYMGRMLELLSERGNGQIPALSLLIGSRRSRTPRPALVPQSHVSVQPTPAPTVVVAPPPVVPVAVAPVIPERSRCRSLPSRCLTWTNPARESIHWRPRCRRRRCVPSATCR